MAAEKDTFQSINGARPGRTARQDIFQQTASAGLQTMGGQVFFDYGDRRLRGPQQYKIYSEMGDDAAAGVLIYLLQNIIRGVKWTVRARGESPDEEGAAQFLESCMGDLDEPFSDFATKAAVGAAQYGHAPYETVYKRRQGTKPDTASAASSKEDDEKIGWASFALIGQDTIQRWLFDDNNRVTAVVQMAAPTYRPVQIDQSVLLNFRNAPYKDGPAGRSMFRRAFRPWLRKKGLEDIESIGVERRMCGLPVIKAPPEVLSDEVGNPNAGLRESLKTIVRDINMNEQAGVLFPLEYDETGKERFTLELLSGGDTAAVDISKIIERYNQEIFRSSLADFLGIGQGTNSGGSYAMVGSKTELYLLGIRAYLRVVCDLINRVAIPRLFALNGMDQKLCPEIEHSPLEQVDVAATCAALQSLAAAGFQVVDPAVLEWISEVIGMPVPKAPEELPALPGMDAPAVSPDTPAGRPIPAPPPRQEQPAGQQANQADPTQQAK